MNENNSIKVQIETGSEYRPSGRLSAALVELQEALAEAHGDDVQGFAKYDGIDGESNDKFLSRPSFKFFAVGGLPVATEGTFKF